MATYTTNLGLIKPAYTDDADISDINDNMDTIDTAFGNISQSTLRDVPLAVAVSDWTAVTGGFSAEFTTAYVTASSKEEVFYDSSLKDYCQAHIIANKKSGGGGIILTTAVKPTGTITGTVRIFDNGDGKVPILIEDTVTPITNGGTGQSSLAGAQQVLGITALNSQIQKLPTTGDIYFPITFDTQTYSSKIYAPLRLPKCTSATLLAIRAVGYGDMTLSEFSLSAQTDGVSYSSISTTNTIYAGRTFVALIRIS